MRRKYTVRVVLAVAVFGIACPVLAALYLAHRQSMDSEIEQANSMTREVLRRSDQAGIQAVEALRRIESAAQPLSCSERGLALMRDIDLESSYLQLVGLVVDGHLICSSLGLHDPPIDLGPVDYVSSRGTVVRSSVALGVGGPKRFLVLQKDGAATAIHPEELIDAFVDRDEVALGVYGASGGTRLSSRGHFDQRWIKRFHDTGNEVFFDGNYLVSMKRSATFDMVAYAAVPVANLRTRLMVFARVLVPIALVLAAALSFGIVKLARQRASLASEMRGALKRRDFILHYQPIVELASRRIVGVEALLRWPKRDGPQLRPDLFIPVAEECGLMPQITRYVLAQVSEDLPRLMAGFPECHVSINLASTDLHSDAIVVALSKLLESSGINPEAILVEATEHSFLDPQRAAQVVAEIRALGIRTAIDDFGTGYSSLSQLTTLQADYLKIDKVFVDTIGTESPTSQVALHIINMAKGLGLTIIGEGVETDIQAKFLHEHGVQLAQGWLFHEAMSLEHLLVILREQAKAAIARF